MALAAGGSVGADSLLMDAPVICSGFIFCACFVAQYLVSFLVLQQFR